MALLILTLLTGITPVLTILISSKLIDLIVQTVAQPQTDQLPEPVMNWLILFGIILLLEQLSIRLRAAIERLYQIRVTNRVQLLIAEKAASLDLAFFENPAFHNQLRNAASEASFRPVTMITQLMMVIAGFMTLFSVMAILLWWKGWVVPVILVSAVLMFVVSTRFGSANVNLVMGRTPEARKAHYLNALLTSDTVAKDIRLFGLQDFFLNSYRDLLNTMYQQDSYLLRRQTLWIGLIELVMAMVRPLLVGLTAVEAFTHLITIGQFNLYAQSIIQLHTRLYSLMATLAQLHENSLFVSNLFRFLSIQPEVEAKRPNSALYQASISPTPHIEFRNVSFRYADTEKKILDRVSFHIRSGEAVALVGENGAGKTTLVKLLAGLYAPTEGEILLDGVDIQNLDRASLRNYLSVIFQDFPVYHFSVSENIAVGDVKHMQDGDRIKAAAERTRLAHLVQEMSDGYDTILGRWFERGHELSGGQRQLVALTRALVREAAVLVLDEPTSALDVHAERHFFQCLLDEQRRCHQAVLFISHRFSTVRCADRILVLENGRILEEGSHTHLMGQQGRYAEMFNLQAEMYMKEHMGTPRVNGSKTAVLSHLA